LVNFLALRAGARDLWQTKHNWAEDKNQMFSKMLVHVVSTYKPNQKWWSWICV